MDSNFYHAFEERYRGSRDVIIDRLRVYLPFIEPFKEAADEEACALDLGCGRGEWLALMAEVGVAAEGADLDKTMIDVCLELGLSVTHADALEYLRGKDDESLSAVTGFHIAEHLPFEVLQDLVAEALRSLRPGGILILETPNPENFHVGSCQFYLDPTHEQPIPPMLLAFLPEYAGFERTKALRLQEPPEVHGPLPPSLLHVLTGVSPDYAIVAQKGSDDPKDIALLDEAFALDHGATINELADRFQEPIDAMSRIPAEMAEAKLGLECVRSQLAELAQIQQQLDQSQVQLSEAQNQLRDIHASLSWRLSAPLRWLGRCLRPRKR